MQTGPLDGVILVVVCEQRPEPMVYLGSIEAQCHSRASIQAKVLTSVGVDTQLP